MPEAILKSGLREISYAEFGAMLEQLTKQVQAYCDQMHVTFDLVVPILRSGGFTGLHLASKLKITKIMPLQYKYVYEPDEHIVKRFEPPKLNFDVPASAHILIADSNTVWGGTAGKAIAEVRAIFPNAALYFATANLDTSYKSPADITQIFYGARSNEARLLNAEDEARLGITHDVLIFPWENLEEQWQEISGAQQ